MSWLFGSSNGKTAMGVYLYGGAERMSVTIATILRGRPVPLMLHDLTEKATAATPDTKTQAPQGEKPKVHPPL